MSTPLPCISCPGLHLPQHRESSSSNTSSIVHLDSERGVCLAESDKILRFHARLGAESVLPSTNSNSRRCVSQRDAWTSASPATGATRQCGWQEAWTRTCPEPRPAMVQQGPEAPPRQAPRRARARGPRARGALSPRPSGYLPCLVLFLSRLTTGSNIVVGSPRLMPVH